MSPIVKKAYLTPKSDTQGKEIKLKVFWKTTKYWDEVSIKEYRSTVEDNAHDFQNNYREWWGDGSIHRGMLTCEDFSLKLLIKFAGSHGLPLKLTTGAGTYRNMQLYSPILDRFTSNPAGYEDMVMPRYGAMDTLQNTVKIAAHKDLLPGDIMLRNDGGHVQVVMMNSPTEIRVKQGNFDPNAPLTTKRRILGKLSKVLTGDNAAMRPGNDNYLGTEIQDGLYIWEEEGRWSYQNTTLKEDKEYKTFKTMSNLCRWNFEEFNR
jgi:hypothetical protein